MHCKSFLAAGIALLASTALVNAQTTSLGVGVGQSQSSSNSNSQSNSAGGSVQLRNNFQISSPGVTTNNNNARNRSSGSLRTTVPAVAPNLVASAVGTCLGSASIGIGATGWGFGAGSTVPDKNCDIRMFSEALMKVGQNAAATAVLCRNPEAYMAMTSVGLRCPILPDGYAIQGQAAGVQPYQVTYAPPPPVQRGRYVEREVAPAAVPVILPQSSPRVENVPNEKYAREQAEAKAAVARIDAEYKTAKAACVARGDRVC